MRYNHEHKKGFFPVNKSGEAMDSLLEWHTLEQQGFDHWEEMKPFNARMQYLRLEYKRVILDDQDGREWSMFESYLHQIIPLMLHGDFSGRFTMKKKGDMYGLVYLGMEE